MPGKTRIDRLTARWDAVPVERQEAYRQVYQRELRQAGATTDDAAEIIDLRLATAIETGNGANRRRRRG